LTYNLPTDYPIFKDEFSKSPGCLWIAKPVNRSQGKGIFIFDKLQQIAEWRSDNRYKPDNPAVKY
jgi:tubulin polyglutamylase TTLL9